LGHVDAQGNPLDADGALADFEYEAVGNYKPRFTIIWDEANGCDAVLYRKLEFVGGWFEYGDRLHIARFDSDGLTVSADHAGSAIPISVLRMLLKRWDTREPRVVGGGRFIESEEPEIWIKNTPENLAAERERRSKR
jgi:hypothetical protein